MSDEKETILIVEDNPDVLFYIGNLLDEKYNLLFSKDGSGAFSKAEDVIPDLIITDLMMPGIDGYELCRRKGIGADQPCTHYRGNGQKLRGG